MCPLFCLIVPNAPVIHKLVKSLFDPILCASTTSCGNKFLKLATSYVKKKSFLLFVLGLPPDHFSPCLLVLVFWDLVNNSSLSTLCDFIDLCHDTPPTIHATPAFSFSHRRVLVCLILPIMAADPHPQSSWLPFFVPYLILLQQQ